MGLEAVKEKREVHPTCMRCGNCCHVDVAAYVTIEDIKRWESEGRTDILNHIRAQGVTWRGDKIFNRFGLNIETCRMTCRFLEWNGSISTCKIYDTRTKVCRDYIPGSTKLCRLYAHEKH